ncbi:hypothetical protein I9W82_002801 [Candida metapsilosis]|uniref:Bul1 C-terminal domain-containing protein n=1 Tax=Candida metapsilosis TaxID=273372 RepID=A0A8H7ZEF4_9ASCO|nr:hypothetical protein I9W82_002801 [Candida metapsilosis]
MPESSIVLDCYPHEVLCEIVNYAGVKNLFQLLDDSFLNSNGSVKRAVNKAIREISSYDYNNKGTADFKNADEVKRFDNHCVNEKLDVVLNLCYDVQTARDLRELQDVLTTFQPSDKTMLQLRIDFSECYLQDVSFASDGTKYNSVKQAPWRKQVETKDFEEKYVKQLVITADMGSLEIRPLRSTDFCLVPDFQNCMIARVYYLKIDVRLQSGEKLSLRVPVVLQRSV